MLTGTVTKNEHWQGHPDVAFFKGRFYVVYRESKHHKSFKNTRINIVSSKTGSQYSKPITLLSSGKSRWNCPRLSVIGGYMWLICDCVNNSDGNFVKSENNPKAVSVWVMSTRDGETWTDPFKTNIKGIVPDRIFMSESGDFFVAAHMYKDMHQKYGGGRLVQNIWRTKNPKTPWDKRKLANAVGHNFCEGSICQTDDGMACMMRENSGNGLPAYISFSKDGAVWSNVKPTRIFGCHRPVFDRLKSGKYLVTYREQSLSLSAKYWAKNTFACLIDSLSEPYCAEGIILPLDHDSNNKSDGGYTGWVQLPNDNIYIVNYITDDAPKPYIKWYLISEEEF